MKNNVLQEPVEIQLCWGTGRIHPKSSGVHPDILAQAHASWETAYKCAHSPKSRKRGIRWSWLLDDWSVVMRFNPANKLRNCYIKKVVSPCGVVFRWPEDEDDAMDFAESQKEIIIISDDDSDREEEEYEDEEEGEEEKEDEMPAAEAGAKRNGNGQNKNAQNSNKEVRFNWGTGAIHNDFIHLEQTALDQARKYWESRRNAACKADDAKHDNWSWLPSDWDLLVGIGQQRCSLIHFPRRMGPQTVVKKYLSPCGAAFSDKRREEAKVFATRQKLPQGQKRERQSEPTQNRNQKKKMKREESADVPTTEELVEEDGDEEGDGDETSSPLGYERQIEQQQQQIQQDNSSLGREWWFFENMVS